MITKLVVPALLLAAACGDNLKPEAGQGQSFSEEDGSGDHDDGPAREIEARIDIQPITCDETIAVFEASARYVDDGSAATNIACEWRFDDGTTSAECTGEHVFNRAGAHDFVLEVTDLATGATDVVTQTRQFHPPLEITLDVTTDGLTISYVATSNTGGEQVVVVEPRDLVISDDPNYPRNTTGTVRVLQAGTYTITYNVEDERGVSEICSDRIVREITVVCEDDGKTH